ncbi:MAG TPA: hypothetical protein VIO11_07420 [Candidatus Methanoperedens sp.]
MKCDHAECSSIEKVWLPYIVRERQNGLKPHLFCTRCGMIKNIGPDKSIGRGYYINIVSKIEKHLNIPGSAVRMRLVAKELEKIEDFDDSFSMSRYNQEKIFINIVKKHYQIPDRTIQQFL